MVMTSSNVITDKDGKQAQLAEYTPFGSLTKDLVLKGPGPDPSATNYLYTGKELDRVTNLYYYGARYYNHQLAKFIQPDPLIQDVYDPQALNHYTYCRNNPLILTDPTGMNWDDTWKTWRTNYDNFNRQMQANWRQTQQNLRQSWDNFRTSSYNSINSMATMTMQSFTSVQQGFYNFGQSLRAGMDYRIKQSTQQIGNYWQDFQQSQQWQQTREFGRDLLNRIGPDPGFGERFQNQFYTDRTPILSEFSIWPIPRGTAIAVGSDIALRKMENSAIKRATSNFTSFSPTRNFVYMSGYRPGYLSISKGLLIIRNVSTILTVAGTAGDMGTAIESAIHVWKEDDK